MSQRENTFLYILDFCPSVREPSQKRHQLEGRPKVSSRFPYTPQLLHRTATNVIPALWPTFSFGRCPSILNAGFARGTLFGANKLRTPKRQNKTFKFSISVRLFASPQKSATSSREGQKSRLVFLILLQKIRLT